MTLAKTLGVGERLAQKITDHFGTEDRVRATLRSGDVARLAEVDGVSLKRALSMARQYAGADGSFLSITNSSYWFYLKILVSKGNSNTSIREIICSIERFGANLDTEPTIFKKWELLLCPPILPNILFHKACVWE